jgi:NitT/TauT family transport system substrate-binding protein
MSLHTEPDTALDTPPPARRVWRRLAVGATLTLALVTTACGSSAGSGTTGQQQAIPMSAAGVKGSIPGMPLFIAKEKGFFAKNGLDVSDVVDLKAGAALISAVSSGSADVIPYTLAGTAVANQTGVGLQVVVPAEARLPYVLVVSPQKAASVPKAAGGDWKATMAALKGVNIAASGPGSAPDITLKSLYNSAGLPTDSFTNIKIAHGGPEVAAVQSGQVDAVLADLGAALDLQRLAGGVPVLDLGSDGPEALVKQAYSGFVTSKSTMDKKPELKERFKATMADVRSFIRDPANLPELHRIAVQVCAIQDSATLDDALKEWSQHSIPDTFTPEQVQNTLKFLKDTGQVPPTATITPNDVVDPTIISAS